MDKSGVAFDIFLSIIIPFSIASFVTVFSVGRPFVCKALVGAVGFLATYLRPLQWSGDFASYEIQIQSGDTLSTEPLWRIAVYLSHGLGVPFILLQSISCCIGLMIVHGLLCHNRIRRDASSSLKIAKIRTARSHASYKLLMWGIGLTCYVSLYWGIISSFRQAFALVLWMPVLRLWFASRETDSGYALAIRTAIASLTHYSLAILYTIAFAMVALEKLKYISRIKASNRCISDVHTVEPLFLRAFRLAYSFRLAAKKALFKPRVILVVLATVAILAFLASLTSTEIGLRVSGYLGDGYMAEYNESSPMVVTVNFALLLSLLLSIALAYSDIKTAALNFSVLVFVLTVLLISAFNSASPFLPRMALVAGTICIPCQYSCLRMYHERTPVQSAVGISWIASVALSATLLLIKCTGGIYRVAIM